MIKFGDLYLEIRQTLRRAGVEAYAMEARELVRCCAGMTREKFTASQALYMDAATEAKCRAALERRLADEPLAYILGEWDFYGLTFQVEPTVLIPRPDTELAAEKAIEYMTAVGEGGRLLDLCTGTGCIGITVAVNVPGCRAVLADISEDALAVTKKNAALNSVSGRTLPVKADAMSDPPEYIGKFHLITCNPPYITEAEYPGLDDSVRLYEPALALLGGRDGLDFYRSVCEKWKKALRPGGRIIFEIGETQAEEVSAILDTNGFIIKDVLKDNAGHDRVVIGELQKDEEI
ncbi:MAG: peptide chain release factor N(5)-glutamine methyltransferase [Oscillospiraceae bacterium]|nr:peptide chain release factor N(5)-glutamine methyltransferase [Oscillospiraceae bacterium]